MTAVCARTRSAVPPVALPAAVSVLCTCHDFSHRASGSLGTPLQVSKRLCKARALLQWDVLL